MSEFLERQTLADLDGPPGAVSGSGSVVVGPADAYPPRFQCPSNTSALQAHLKQQLRRADMQRLLAAARAAPAPFRAVLADDLSRLSGDLGNTWQIVFQDLASADVRVIDITTGLASDGAGARLL